MFWFVTKLFFYVYIGKMNINFEVGPMSYSIWTSVPNFPHLWWNLKNKPSLVLILPFHWCGIRFQIFIFIFVDKKKRFREPPIVFPQYSVKIIHFICFKGAAVFNFFCLHSLRKYETKIDKILTLSSGTLKGKSRIIDSIFNYFWMISF